MNRRSLLKLMGGAALGLPFLECFGDGLAHAYTPPKRLLFLFTHNGTDPRIHWPTGSETSFTLGEMMQPLLPYQQDLIVLHGVDNQAAMAMSINGHTDAVRCMLTGRAATNQSNTDYTAGGGPSIDQFIANQIGTTTPFKSVEYQTQYVYANPTTYANFYAANQPIPYHHEPYKLFTQLFAGVQTGTEDPAFGAQRLDRQSVLDGVYQNYGLAMKRVGASDRQRLEAHLDRVRDLEQQILAEVGPSCVVPPAPHENPQQASADSGIACVVNALGCDLTRVASININQYGFQNLGISASNYHDDSLHNVLASETAAADVKIVKQWQHSRVAYVLDQLRAIPDGNGTLFDNTLVVYADEFCHGYAHQHHEVPYVLFCGSNRFFEMGRYLRYTTPVGNNGLWLSLRDAMGATGDFGDPQFGDAPLPGLT